jgi:acyl carrier protein
VKINGLRVEPGEIETNLVAHPDIERAVAFAAGGAGGQRLACAYVAKPGARPDSSALARHLAGVLPDYMVPQVFLPLDALPLTANGKVDRKALIEGLAADNATAGAAAAEPGRAPSGEVETVLAAIWAEVLKTEPTPANVPFPALGGTSLSAVRIVAEIARRLRHRLTVKEFTQLGTIEALARHLEARRGLGTAAE